MRILVSLFLLASLFLASCHSSKKASSSTATTTKNDRPPSKKEREKQIDEAIKAAYGFKGTPYRIGGMDKKGVDCSGLIKVCYQRAGLTLPRTTDEMASIGNSVKESNLREGDLVFFATNRKKSKDINHVGLVTKVENDEDVVFIHASLQKGVMENKLSEKYYKEAFVKAIRPF